MISRRRRGQQLEQEILDTVRAELVEHGYAGLTYDKVAAAASTSKAVLYRRWPVKAEMVIAALTNRMEPPLTTPDTGSLAKDLTTLLCSARDRVQSQDRETALNLLAALDQTAADSVREVLLAFGFEALDPILARARQRGELGSGTIPKRALAMPFDLVRHDMLIQDNLCRDEDIEAIVNNCAIPLFGALSRGNAARETPTATTQPELSPSPPGV